LLAPLDFLGLFKKKSPKNSWTFTKAWKTVNIYKKQEKTTENNRKQQKTIENNRKQQKTTKKAKKLFCFVFGYKLIFGALFSKKRKKN
jgi:hypothetical protein